MGRLITPKPEDGNASFGVFSDGLDTGPRIDGDSAQTYSGVWACVKIISEAMACLPLHIVERGAAWRRVVDHPAATVLNRVPNIETDGASFREGIFRECLLHGNFFAEIETTRGGDVLALWRIPSDQVEIKRDDNGTLVYEIDDGMRTQLPAERVFHVKGPSNDGIVGMSTVSFARKTIALGLSVDEYGRAFFGNGAQLGGIITNKAGGMTPEAVKNLLDTFNRKHQGANKAHRVGYLDGDMEYKSMSVPPEDAQFLESRRFNILEICRWFRVPPHKLAELERSTHTNIEAQNIEFVTDTLLPWAVRFESAINTRLLDPYGDLVAKVNTSGLLRGDSAGRAAFYSSLHNLGAISANEIRALEDMAPIEGGDKHYVQMNLAAIEDGDTTEEDAEEESTVDEGARAQAIAEIAAIYERAACNGLRKCRSGRDVVAWLDDQPNVVARIYRPLALAIHGNTGGVNQLGNEVKNWLKSYIEGEAATMTPQNGAESLRGRLSCVVADAIRGQNGTP
jgi:HK97 family phage portal protein